VLVVSFLKWKMQDVQILTLYYWTGGGESDGSGIINARVLNVSAWQTDRLTDWQTDRITIKSLQTGGVNTNVGTNVSMCQPVSSGIKLSRLLTLNSNHYYNLWFFTAARDQSSCRDGLDMCCPDVGYTCGKWTFRSSFWIKMSINDFCLRCLISTDIWSTRRTSRSSTVRRISLYSCVSICFLLENT
jgi:hypothetical protein